LWLVELVEHEGRLAAAAERNSFRRSFTCVDFALSLQKALRASALSGNYEGINMQKYFVRCFAERNH